MLSSPACSACRLARCAISRSRWLSILALLGGLSLAILFHALHNFVVRYQFAGLLLSWLIQSSGVLVVLAVAVLAWRHERRWMEEELGDEVRAGVLTARDYAEIMSSQLRVRRQIAALLSGGWPRYRQVRRLHNLATKLAFRKSQARLSDDCHPADACDRLRHEDYRAAHGAARRGVGLERAVASQESGVSKQSRRDSGLYIRQSNNDTAGKLAIRGCRRAKDPGYAHKGRLAAYIHTRSSFASGMIELIQRSIDALRAKSATLK